MRPSGRIALDERAKIYDLAIEGINAVLRCRGFPDFDILKGGRKRQGSDG
jgi:hypothetical protein